MYVLAKKPQTHCAGKFLGCSRFRQLSALPKARGFRCAKSLTGDGGGVDSGAFLPSDNKNTHRERILAAASGPHPVTRTAKEDRGNVRTSLPSAGRTFGLTAPMTLGRP